MKILFLTDNFPPELNAGASRVFERACHWVQWGHQVTVITSAPNFPEGKLYQGYKNKFYQKEMVAGIHVIRVKTFIAPNKGFFLRTIDFLSYMISSFMVGLFQKKPDIIIATSPQFFTAVSGWGLAFCKKTPFIFELGDIWPAAIKAVGAIKNGFILKAVEKLELFLYRHSTKVVALTAAFKKNLMLRGIAEEKIAVIVNGVDLSRYRKNKRNLTLAKKYNLVDAFVVGYIGTLGMAQALEHVLITAEFLLKDHRKIKFIFVGAGAKRSELMEITKKKQLTNVQFVPAQSKEKIGDFWSICDVALISLKNEPTFSEVIPSKMFEAMGMGLPIILAAPAGEASALLEKENIGIWVNAESPMALKQAIVNLESNPAIYKHYADRSFAAAPLYSRELQSQKMLNLMNEIVCKNKDVLKGDFYAN